MRLEQKLNLIELTKGSTSLKFLQTGDVREYIHEDILINQLIGNILDGSINKLYLRIYKEDCVEIFPLVGKEAKNKISYNEESIKWEGIAGDINYTVVLTLVSETIWCYSISLNGNGEKVDLLYGQDISLAMKGSTLTNELYMSQYIDHKVLKGKNGYIVASRQNQSQANSNPYFEQGTIDIQAIHFSTDAMQFFGKEYKFTNIEKVLFSDLEDVNYQFEMAYIGLQTEPIQLVDEVQFGIYNLFKKNYPTAIDKVDSDEEKSKAWEYSKKAVCAKFEAVHSIKRANYIGQPLASSPFTLEEIDDLFKERELEEKVEEKLLSFFTPQHAHVVLQEKEYLCERPHGHIITSGMDEKTISTGLITSTNYMYGVFHSQVVVGNTNLNKMLSTTRSLLNTQKNSGQRIYVKLDDCYHLLTMPAAYELGANYSKWFYKIEDDILIIKAYAAQEASDLVLEVESIQNKKYQFLITNQLVMGEHEYQVPSHVEVQDNKVICTLDETAFAYQVYPELNYTMQVYGTPITLSDDSLFFEDRTTYNGTLLIIETNRVHYFQIVISGRLTKQVVEEKQYQLAEEIAKYEAHYKRLMNQLNLSMIQKEDEDIKKMNHILWWYTHNAMVHYSVPHGLEQPGGAAWGTRDICQGPIEYFFATQNYPMVKEIIKEIFAHQFFEVGEWPQWFMFGLYRMQQDDCHGDVVFWPLKVVGDYMTITGDIDILDEPIVYRHESGQVTEFKHTLLEHIKLAVETIKTRFLYDTALISYAGGDWDDTLQPANKALKEKLVSAWTVALAYQSLKGLIENVKEKDISWTNELEIIVKAIKNDFNTHLIKNDVIAGFVYCEDKDKFEYMLHPEDQKTGIQYRLLPMTRSIISELVDLKQAKKNIELIKEHLKCPDGVRLMNNPARYTGGVSKFFQRAEQASNVGREIGLNYVHAHIRYIEAMAKVGDAKEAWEAMMKINPILIHEKVPNAQIRQSNAYFSSSDGMFSDRYVYQDKFEKLRKGEIGVKGGWRIYSSGPGIYFNQIVSNLFGLRQTASHMIIDPVLPQDKDGMVLTYYYKDKAIEWIYHIESEEGSVHAIEIDGKMLPTSPLVNRYRKGGILVQKDIFEQAIEKDSKVHIYIR